MHYGSLNTRHGADMGVLCSTTTLYHLQDSLRLSPTGTALLNFGDLSYAGELAAPYCPAPEWCTLTLPNSGIPGMLSAQRQITPLHHANPPSMSMMQALLHMSD